MVYVLNMRKQPLMPCSSKKASDLLKAGKAVVQQRTPFTIRLTVATGEAKQPVVVGLDPAFKGGGVCAVANGKEVYAAEMELRTDEVELNSERRMYRRNRRNRLLVSQTPVPEPEENRRTVAIQHQAQAGSPCEDSHQSYGNSAGH